MERLSESNDPKERSDIDWTPLHHLADYPLSNLLLSIDLRLDTPTIVENVKELIESSRKVCDVSPYGTIWPCLLRDTSANLN